jgi:two-component system chemotaxis response regulator CheB
VRVVAVGVSTGGPNTLAKLLNEIPEDFPVPILIVQHMPEGFTAPLARRLSTQVAISVVEAANGQALKPGKAYIAPGNKHMEVSKSSGGATLQITQGPPENSCRPSVDVLFRSVARVFGPGVLAAVLTGMGQDGLRGAESVTLAGGKVLVQDEATSVVWGMPGAVVRAGLADQVMPVERLAREIVHRTPSPNPLKAALLEEISAHQSGRV